VTIIPASVDVNSVVTWSYRGVIVAMFPLMGYLAIQYLDYRFAEVRSVATEAASRADTAAAATFSAADVAAHVSSRVDVIEANMASSTAVQRQISRQVDKLTDVVTATSVQVAGLSATLNAWRAESATRSPVGSLP
jgi:hypothetical protein